jgi:hypothetical protein
MIRQMCKKKIILIHTNIFQTIRAKRWLKPFIKSFTFLISRTQMIPLVNPKSYFPRTRFR